MKKVMTTYIAIEVQLKFCEYKKTAKHSKLAVIKNETIYWEYTCLCVLKNVQ